MALIKFATASAVVAVIIDGHSRCRIASQHLLLSAYMLRAFLASVQVAVGASIDWYGLCRGMALWDGDDSRRSSGKFDQWPARCQYYLI